MVFDFIFLLVCMLCLGMILFYDLFDVGGKLLFVCGQVLCDLLLVCSLVDGGVWVQFEDMLEYQCVCVYCFDIFVLQDVLLVYIVKVDISFWFDLLSVVKVEFGLCEVWLDLLLCMYMLLCEVVLVEFFVCLVVLCDVVLKWLQVYFDLMLMLLVFESSQFFEDYSVCYVLLMLLLCDFVVQ